MTNISAVTSSYTTNAAANTLKKEEAEKLTKYVKGEALKEVPDTFVSSMKSNAGFTAAFEGIPLALYLKRGIKAKNTKKLATSYTDKLMQNAKKALGEVFHGKGKLSERIGNYIKAANDTKAGYSEAKTLMKSGAKAEKLAKKGKDISKLAQKATEAESKLVKLTSKSGAKAAGEAAGKLGKLGKFGKMLKSSGAGFMLAFSGIIEGATEVIPTFKELGSEKGMKQLGKSAVKVIGDTVGFIGGEQLGVAVGTAIGTAIFPGVGSAAGAAIGGICGMIFGMAGSFLAGKATKAITGKSEREIAKEQQMQQQANLVTQDASSAQELKEAAALKLAQEAQYGNVSEDGKEILKILNGNNNALNTPSFSITA